MLQNPFWNEPHLGFIDRLFPYNEYISSVSFRPVIAKRVILLRGERFLSFTKDQERKNEIIFTLEGNEDDEERH